MSSPHEFLESLMGQKLRITLCDSRTVIGTVECIDNSTNFILHDVEVFLDKTNSPCQLLNSVMVNGKHITRIEQIVTP